MGTGSNWLCLFGK